MSKSRIALSEISKIAIDMFGTNVVTRANLNKISDEKNVSIPSFIRRNPIARNKYLCGETAVYREFDPEYVAPIEHVESSADIIPAVAPVVTEVAKPVAPITGFQTIRNLDADYSIAVDPNYVRHGNFSDISCIVKSKRFFPTFVTGLSGNGKTTTIEQACAANKREMIRVNFTKETNEGDLLGGMRLINGNTIFQYGPVVEAYLRGAVLILDEVDLACHSVMCLQSVLEGKPIFIPKLSKSISPADGFQVFATANTKGKGSIDGRFAGTNTLNEAFLDRFSISIVQPYPTPTIERKILVNFFESFSGNTVTEQVGSIISDLVTWGGITRKAFIEGSVEELISTRRLISAIQSYIIFGNLDKVISYTVNRFDDDTAESFKDLFNQITEGLLTAESEDGDTAVDRSI
ncbi:MAG: MoxR family ATPase [Ghiorsea sp.]